MIHGPEPEMGHEIDWSRHIPLYRLPDGTVWMRFLRDDPDENTYMSHRLVEHTGIFGVILGPVFLRYNPNPTSAIERTKERVTLLGGHGAYHALRPLLFATRPGLLFTVPINFVTIENQWKWGKSAGFLSWGFPEFDISNGQSNMIVSAAEKKWGLPTGTQGQPLIHPEVFEIYRLLGINPLLLPGPTLKALVEAQKAADV